MTAYSGYNRNYLYLLLPLVMSWCLRENHSLSLLPGTILVVRSTDYSIGSYFSQSPHTSVGKVENNQAVRGQMKRKEMIPVL